MSVRVRRRPAADPRLDAAARERPLALRRPRVSERTASALAEWAVVFGVSFVLAVALTWPLARRMTTGMYGFGNDNYAGAWNAEWLHQTAWGPGEADFTHRLQAPFGMDIDQRFIQPLDRLLAILFGGFADGLLAVNLQIFASFVLAGPAMYALARYLTGSRAAAALAGVIFMASPFHFAMAMQYPSLATVQWTPLLVLATLLTLRRRRLRDAAFVGVTLALTWLSSYYYGWFSVLFLLAVLLTAGALGLVSAVRHRRARAAVSEGAAFLVTRGGVALGTFLALVLPFLLPLALKVQAEKETYSRSLEDIYMSAVKPWQYVLPPHDNPLLGRFTRDFIQAHTGILPVYEQAVYVGVIPTLLGVVAFLGFRRIGARARYAVPLLVPPALLMVLLTLGAALPVNPFSVQAWMDPSSVATVPNITVPLFDLVPMFRYYGRTFVFTSVCLASLAAIGFALLQRRVGRRSRVGALALAAGACAFVLAEFVNMPPFRWLDLTKPPWVAAVERLPRGEAVVDYPLQGFYGPRSAYYIFAEAQHDHPTVNPAASAEAKELSFAMEDPNNPESGRRLHEAGIRYAVVHTVLLPQTFPPYQPALPDDSLSPNTGAANPWFDRVATVRDAIVYRVRSRPRASQPSVSVAYGTGFSDEETDGRDRWRWMSGDRASLSLYVGGPPRWFSLSFAASSFFQPRRLVVSVDGRVVQKLEVPRDTLRQLVLPLLLGQGSHDVDLRVAPGAVVANDYLHNGDLRHLSARITPPSIEEVEAGAAASFGRGFAPKESVGAEDRRWIVGDHGELLVAVTGIRRRLLLVAEAESFAKRRRLTLSVDGRPLESVELAADTRHELAVPLVLGPGLHRVALRAAPGGVVADSVLGNGDQRPLSVRVSAPEVHEFGSGAVVTFGHGFGAEEKAGGVVSRWMTGRTSVLDVDVAGRKRRFHVVLRMTSFARSRKVELAVDGRRVASAAVPADRFRSLSFPLELAPGSHRISVRTPSRPTLVASVAGNDDRRRVTLRVQEPRLEDRAAAVPPASTLTETATARFGEGFSGAETDESGTWRWLAGDEGSLSARVTRRPGRYDLTFAAMSLADVRTLRATVDGKPVLTVQVPPAKPQDFRVPLTLDRGRHTVRFEVEPGARRIDEVVESTDRRRVSIKVREPELRPSGSTIRLPFASAAYAYGFARPVPGDAIGWRWMSGENATLAVAVTGPRRRVLVSFRAQSFRDRSRTLTVRLGGRKVASRVVSTDRPNTFRVPLVAGAGTHSIALESEPGAVFHGEQPLRPDPRKVSVRVSTPVVDG